MIIQSKSALIAALIASAPHLMLAHNFLGGSDDAETTWTALLTGLMISPPLIALVAAFSPRQAFRVAALTSAVVAFPCLLVLFLMLLFPPFAFFYVPSLIALLVAAIQNGLALQQPRMAFLAAAVGAASGILIQASWWPGLQMYDSCRTSTPDRILPNGVQTVHCYGGLIWNELALAAAILVGAACLLCLTAAMSNREGMDSHPARGTRHHIRTANLEGGDFGGRNKRSLSVPDGVAGVRPVQPHTGRDLAGGSRIDATQFGGDRFRDPALHRLGFSSPRCSGDLASQSTHDACPHPPDITRLCGLDFCVNRLPRRDSILPGCPLSPRRGNRTRHRSPRGLF